MPCLLSFVTLGFDTHESHIKFYNWVRKRGHKLGFTFIQAVNLISENLYICHNQGVFFSPQFCDVCNHSGGDHQQEGISQIWLQVDKKNLHIFWWPIGTYCLNITISKIVFSKFGTLWKQCALCKSQTGFSKTQVKKIHTKTNTAETQAFHESIVHLPSKETLAP